jgi:hypothetical protein
VLIPPAGAEVQRRDISIRFDVDCGELVPGHHFIARGVSLEEMVSPEEMAKIEWPYVPEPVERGPDQSYFYSRTYRVPEGGFPDDDESDDAKSWRSWRRHEAQIAAAPKIRGVSLHYEIAPGIPAADSGDDDGWARYLVGVEFHSDVPLPTDDDDGGSIEPPAGGPTTYGQRGPWPLADGARLLTFGLLRPDSFDEVDGRLVVDIVDGTSRWAPTMTG